MQIKGRENMNRSALTFLPKNKLARMAIGAFAMLAMAVPAMTQEAPQKDEVFTRTTAIGVPGSSKDNPFFSFDISWVDPALNQLKYFLADRNNKAIDVVHPADNSIEQFHQAFAGFTGDNATGGPNGVLTVHQDSGVTELWVGDTTPGPGPGRVWVLNASDGSNILGDNNTISVGGTTRADELCFDPVNHLIMIASPDEGNIDAMPPKFPYVTFISTTDHKVKCRLAFDADG